MSGTTTRAAVIYVAVCAMMLAGAGVEARKQPQDVAAKLSGTWVLNRDLSSGFGKPAPGRGRGVSPSAGLQRQGPLFAAAAAPQRGGGGRGGGGAPNDATDMTPEQRAEQAAMRELEQISDRITIKASADSVTFADGGERTYAINDKASSIQVGGTSMKVKSKWDKKLLKQEFSNSQAKLTQTWGLDDAGHMVLTMKVESMTLNLGAGADRPQALVSQERKAVFDRQ